MPATGAHQEPGAGTRTAAAEAVTEAVPATEAVLAGVVEAVPQDTACRAD